MSDDLQYYIKDLIQTLNNRGHASSFAQIGKRDRSRVERLIANEFMLSMQSKFGVNFTNITLNKTDPPDCYASLKGRLISIELTELVDGYILSEVQKAKHDNKEVNSNHGSLFNKAQWSIARFEEELNSRIDSKNTKYLKNGQKFNVLVIYTAENWLNPDNVQDWLEEMVVKPRESFGTIYLLMDYMPGHSYNWPIFKLYDSII